jgi:hypothetical protein
MHLQKVAIFKVKRGALYTMADFLRSIHWIFQQVLVHEKEEIF